jgi:outer membrane protein TolC
VRRGLFWKGQFAMGPKSPSLRRLAIVVLLCEIGCAMPRTPRAGPAPAGVTRLFPADVEGTPLQGGESSEAVKARPAAQVTNAGHLAHEEPQQSLPVTAASDGLPSAAIAEESTAGRREGSGDPDTLPDFSLEEAIRLTFEANPDLRSSWERTRIADEILANARTQFYPTLSVNQANQVSNNPLREFTSLLSQGVSDPQQLFPLQGPQSISHSQVRLQHDLYTGGLVSARSQAAESEFQASQYSLAALRNKLTFQVAEAYYHAFQANALVGVSRETVEQMEDHLRAAQSRFNADTLVESDVLRVEVRLAEAREALSSATNSLELARAVLDNVMGLRLEWRRLPEELSAAPWSSHVDQVEAAIAAVSRSPIEQSNDLEAAVGTAEELRPEMGEVAHLVEAAKHRVRAAQAGKYPTVSFVGDYDFFAGERTSINSYFFGLVVSLNLFDGGRTRTNVRQAEARVREALARHERLKLDIELDVRRSSLQLKDARERVTSAAALATSAAANLHKVESRFRGQKATTSELLDAQVLLSDARVRSISAAADVEIARAALERAVGRLSTFVDTCLPVVERPNT